MHVTSRKWKKGINSAETETQGKGRVTGEKDEWESRL